ncbi:unnamed protein product [Bursaphelenchus xylophilus]|uniref:(pine wood nematode) hypothetical protein n=1 Tax=Bursaphelenchus xylophilus TaxID=6326 RepID=A0A1I7SF56_BURXY|nr:unnamed protein product [Bursaphelenchus xylophilus]CAG9078753.1 unnamed protein product [Bursaphelenchus xylophilus]
MKRYLANSTSDRVYKPQDQAKTARERTQSFLHIRDDEMEMVDRMARSFDETGLDEVNEIIDHNYYKDEDTPRIVQEHLKFPKDETDIVFTFEDSPPDSMAPPEAEVQKVTPQGSPEKKGIELNPSLSLKQKAAMIKRLQESGIEYVDESPNSSPEKNMDQEMPLHFTPSKRQQTPHSQHSTPKNSPPRSQPDQVVFHQVVCNNTGMQLIVPYEMDFYGRYQPGIPYPVVPLYCTAKDIPPELTQPAQDNLIFPSVPVPESAHSPASQDLNANKLYPASHLVEETIHSEINRGYSTPFFSMEEFYRLFETQGCVQNTAQQQAQPKIKSKARRNLNFGPEVDQMEIERINEKTHNLSGEPLDTKMRSHEKPVECDREEKVQVQSESQRERRPSTSSDKRKDEGPCGYCLSTNKEMIAYNHSRRTCPTLQKMEPCGICGASGENNHTQMHCPAKKPVWLERTRIQDRPWWGFPPPVVAPKGQYKEDEVPAEWMCNRQAQFPVEVFKHIPDGRHGSERSN